MGSFFDGFLEALGGRPGELLSFPRDLFRGPVFQIDCKKHNRTHVFKNTSLRCFGSLGPLSGTSFADFKELLDLEMHSEIKIKLVKTNPKTLCFQHILNSFPANLGDQNSAPK